MPNDVFVFADFPVIAQFPAVAFDFLKNILAKEKIYFYSSNNINTTCKKYLQCKCYLYEK